MSKKIEIDPRQHTPGLYDSATGESLKAEMVVDITDECPSGEHTILLFTRAQRGRIVQISHPYNGEAYMGSHIHFFVDELDHQFNVEERYDTFGSTAKRSGLSKTQFRELIESNAPSATE